MNERIQELIKQSTHVEEPDGLFPREVFDKEKFAELIVKECLLQIADVRIENNFKKVGDAVLVKALAGIKQHFGVKE